MKAIESTYETFDTRPALLLGDKKWTRESILLVAQPVPRHVKHQTHRLVSESFVAIVDWSAEPLVMLWLPERARAAHADARTHGRRRPLRLSSILVSMPACRSNLPGEPEFSRIIALVADVAANLTRPVPRAAALCLSPPNETSS